VTIDPDRGIVQWPAEFSFPGKEFQKCHFYLLQYLLSSTYNVSNGFEEEMRLGIGSYAYAWAASVPGYPVPAQPLDVFDLVAEAHALGLHLVQICDNIPLPKTHDELKRLAEEAAQYEIALELGTRGTATAHLQRILAAACVLRSPLVRTLVSRPGVDGIVEAERDLREVLPSFEGAGVTLAVENYEAHQTADLASMIRRFASRRLGVCLDTVNSLGALEDIDQVTSTLLPLAVSIHVKDFRIRRLDHQMGFLVEGTPAGTGKLDIPRLLEAGKSGGRDPGIILEQWTPWQDSVDATVSLERSWARQSIDYLRRWITS
jgi:sugar phosphate isomerase/epimerase